MSNHLSDCKATLDSLDRAKQDPRAALRRAPRRRWRKRLKVKLVEPGGSKRIIDIITRNLSSGGLSFLNNGYLNLGTRCLLQLTTVEDASVNVQGTVVRCRYIAGRLHEVSLKFDEPIDDSQFMSKKLSARILLVDDAEDLLRLTGHFLSKAGAEVVTATRGVKALKLVAEQDFDLVLLDVTMPGISGPAVAQTLRDRGITIPIIAYTANNDEATREACLSAGCSDVLFKPLSKQELIDRVMAFLTVEEPITSKYADNPDMAELLDDFVSTLPDRIREMRRYVQERKKEELSTLAQQLRVTASDEGGYGFGEISEAAEKLEVTLGKTVDWSLVEKAMFQLSSLAHRVKASST